MRRRAAIAFPGALLVAALVACASIATDEVAPPPAAAPPTTAPAAPERLEVVIRGRTFRLEIAADDVSRARGLMDRTEIPEAGGMVFAWPSAGFRSMWMANCLVAMDLLYVDDRGRVVDRHAMRVEPSRGADEPAWLYEARLPRYRSRRPVPFAIELRAGTIESLGIEPGDVVEMDRARLRRAARRIASDD